MEHIDNSLASQLVAGTDRLERSEIEALAEERLHFLVEYARKNSPYLKEKYADLKQDFELADIPIATRSEIVENFDRWVCDPQVTKEAVDEYVSDIENIYTPFLGKYSVVSTSGTTSEPLRVIRDARHNAIHGALMNQRYFHGPLLRDVEGVDDPDIKSCALVAPGGTNSSYLSYLRTLRAYEQRGIADRIMFLSTLTPIDQMVKELNKFQPEMIGCYPSVIYTLAFEQKAGRLNIHPRFIGCSAEKLPEENRKFISEAFGCPVNDNYCNTEGGEVAMLCPNGHMHLNSDWIIVEPVNKDNNPVASGEKSEGILMTNLACLVQPIIRYRMSDSIILHNEKCGCGINTPYIEIDGRVEDILEFDRSEKIVRIPGILLYICAKEAPGFDHCQFIQRSPSDLELRIMTMSTHDKTLVERNIAENIRGILDEYGLTDVKITIADEPPMRTKSGKLRISYRAF